MPSQWTKTLDHDGQPKRRRYTTVARSEQWWVEKARESPFYFIWYVSGYQPARHHKIWLANMFDTATLRINMIAPRESAKTTISVYSLLWLMCKYPLQSYGIISVSHAQAQDRAQMIRNIIGYNTRFQNVFPHIQIDTRRPDTKSEFSIWSTALGTYSMWRTAIARGASTLDKNPSLFTAGAGGKGVIGRRFSGVLLLDDMVDETYLTTVMQDKMMDYINRTLEPCVTEVGRIWNIGTRWMVDDIYERLEANSQWKTITIPAILHGPDGRELSYWPEFWPLERLEKKRQQINDDLMFRIMYLCDPAAVTGALFERGWLQQDLPAVFPEFVEIYVTTDFAVSQEDRADWNVIYIVAIDAEDNFYILDGLRFKDEAQVAVDYLEQMADIAYYTYGQLDGVLIEKVAFQAVFAQLFSNVRPYIDTYEIQPKGDKHHRAKPVSYWARRNKMFINQRISFIDQLVSEWFNFPVHRYDDTLDPISMLFQHRATGIVEASMIRVLPSAEKVEAIKRKRRERRNKRNKNQQTA